MTHVRSQEKTGRLTQHSLELIHRMMISRQPVLVLGPGCQRIGYDAGPGWKEVRTRVRLLYARVAPEPSDDDDTNYEADPTDVIGAMHAQFLEALWRTKLSDETRLELATTLRDEWRIDLPEEGRDRSALDAVRTDFAARLLCLLSESTRCLGLIIAQGAAPVTSWADVSYQLPATNAEAEVAHGLAGHHLAEFVRMTSVIGGYGAPVYYPIDEAHDQLGKWGIPFDDGIDDVVKRFAEVTKISAVHNHVSTLLVTSFQDVRKRHLSGGMLEWLSDLLWHIISTDSEVPASQSELAFYVNLNARAELDRRRDFERASPGEYHGGGADELHDDIVRLHRVKDHGLGRGKWDFDHDERARFHRTIAATLVAMWLQREARHDALKEKSPIDGLFERLPPPIALVSAYDLVLERQVWEVLDVGARFHTVVPVWLTTRSSRSLRWLWGTVRKAKPKSNFDPAQMVGPPGIDRQVTWDWWDEDDDARFEPMGPVLVKVNGSPLHDLGDRKVKPSDLGLPGPGRGELELAALYAEHELVPAIVNSGNTPDMLPPQLARAIQWELRSWLFFGDGFPDWVPRLRLTQHARTRRDGRSDRDDDVRERIALDRAFDWPELALLDALEVDSHEGNLSGVALYPSLPATGAGQAFIGDVESKLPWLGGSR